MKFSTGREILAVPDHIQNLIRHAGGLNRFGHANYRIVWNWSRLDWIGGEWIDRDASGNYLRTVLEMRRVPKYLPFDRFSLERWVPPESYGSPANWYAQTLENCDGLLINALGPYPTLGDYELSLTIEENGQFAALNGDRIHKVVRAIEYSRAVDEIKRRMAIEEREARQVKADEKAVDEIIGADPAPISKERMEYVERCITPQLDIALASAARRKHDLGTQPSHNKCTVGAQL